MCGNHLPSFGGFSNITYLLNSFDVHLTNVRLLFALDTDGFVIPSLVVEEQDKQNQDAPTVEASKPPSPKVS